MADLLTTTAELTSVANAIRTKGGTSASLSYPNGFITAINNMSVVEPDTPFKKTRVLEIGKTWTEGRTALNLNSLAYGNGRFVAGTTSSSGPVIPYYSLDGKTWQASSSSIKWFDIKYCNGIFVGQEVLTNHGLAYSTDGNTWTQSNINSISGASYIFNNGSSWVAGINPLNSGSISHGIFYSTDGMSWIRSQMFSKDTWFSIWKAVYGNNTWVAAAQYGIAYSTDNGQNWTWSNLYGSGYSEYDLQVFYLNNQFIAYESNNVYTSNDGITWTLLGISNLSYTPTKMEYYNNLYVVNDTSYSSDGLVWVAPVYTDFKLLTKINGVLFAAPDDNSFLAGLYYSLTGNDWVSLNLNSYYIGTVYMDNQILIAATTKNAQSIYYSEFEITE